MRFVRAPSKAIPLPNKVTSRLPASTAGDLVGFDAIGTALHPSFAQALETSMVCEIPFETLDDLSGKMPNLRQQMMRLMSGEIKGDQT